MSPIGRATALSHPLDFVAERIVKGDHEAFDRLYDLMADRLLGFGYRILNDRSDAEDAVQQAFLELARSTSRPDNGRSLESWLFTSMRYTCIDLLRRRSRRPEVLHDQLPELGDEDHYQLGGDPELEGAMARLTSEQRIALSLKYVQGFDGRQIAEIMGSNRVAVYAMIGRAERQLKKQLTPTDSIRSRQSKDSSDG